MGRKTEKICDRAEKYLDNGNREQALRLFNQVLNREPSHARALQNKALIKIKEDNATDIKKFLLFAVEQQPEDDILRQILGNFYHQQDEYEKALKQLKKAIALNNDNASAHTSIGIISAQHLDDHEKAITHFSKSIALTKDNAATYFNRGCSYLILNQFEQAEKDLRKADEMGYDKAQQMVSQYFES